MVERNNDKNAVIALREIAAKKININSLRENLIQDFCKLTNVYWRLCYKHTKMTNRIKVLNLASVGNFYTSNYVISIFSLEIDSFNA